MKWTSTFKFLPIDYSISLARIQDRTQRVIFANNLLGGRVRVLLSNKFAKGTLRLERMTVGRAEGGTVAEPEEVLLRGCREIILQPGEEVYSDEIALHTEPGSRIAVSCYIGCAQEIESVCGFWAKGGPLVTLNRHGDATDGREYEDVPAQEIYPLIQEDPSPLKAMFFYGFSVVQVYTEDSVKSIAAFGDSITHMGFVANELYKRLYQAYPGRAALQNCGIGGNRLLRDATYIEEAPGHARMFGQAGIKRFERDVFGTEETDTVLVLAGINDIMHPVRFGCDGGVPPAAGEMEKGYMCLAETAKKHHARIFGATITPCGNREYPEGWMELFEGTRLPVNEWLRSTDVFEKVFDYDAAVRDEEKSGYMRAESHIGDGLHPNEKGGAAISDTIDLGLLMGEISKNDNPKHK